MKSRWSYLKPRAIGLRKRGLSLRDVEAQLSIPRSTLSGWFKDIELTKIQTERLLTRHANALILARIKAAEWHKAQKVVRLSVAQSEAEATLKKLNKNDNAITELALAMLYYGEGSKSDRGLVLANSNLHLLQFFISALHILYHINGTHLRAELHLRADQNATLEIAYWSKNLKIPRNRFKGIYFDKRTSGRTTYPSYHGVCVVALDNVAIQRKLMYLYGLYCERAIRKVLRA